MLATPDVPITHESLEELDRELEQHLGRVGATTLFEDLAEPLDEPSTERSIEIPLMGGTGNKTLCPFGKGTSDDWDDWED